MQKNIILFLIVISIHFIFSNGACHKVSPNHLKLFHKEVTRSIIGITGKDSTDAYIEIFYTKKKTDTTNEVVHLWVKPPYLFGDEPVISQVRRYYYKRGYSNMYAENAYFTFTEGGDAYLKIVNHSNSPIEMFVAVNFKLDIVDDKNHNASREGGCKGDYFIYRYPVPLYKKAPIYYLLFPEKIPNKTNMNVIDNGNCIVNNLEYTDQKVGDIEVTRAWTIEEVMSLYRAEYRQSLDTILYGYYELRSVDNRGLQPPVRISLLPTNNVYYNYIWGKNSSVESYYPERMFGFYKKINAQESFLSEENQWYPMTNAIDDSRSY